MVLQALILFCGMAFKESPLPIKYQRGGGVFYQQYKFF